MAITVLHYNQPAVRRRPPAEKRIRVNSVCAWLMAGDEVIKSVTLQRPQQLNGTSGGRAKESNKIKKKTQHRSEDMA